MSEPHKLSLLTNSISFFREALRYTETDTHDPGKWKFAVINVVQAMELALKEALSRIHPAFIFEDIDNPKPNKTVSISKALARLRDERIGNFQISNQEVGQFKTAIELRNQLVHQECSYPEEHAEAKFSNIFAFMLFFYEDHLGIDRSQIISDEQHRKILSLTKTRKELQRRVREFIEENQSCNVWLCPECGEDTYIVEDGRCKLCGCDEPVIECPTCGEKNWEADLRDITCLFDVDEDEGRSVVLDRFGYEANEGCPNCYDRVKEDIKSQRFSHYCEQMEEEAFYETNSFYSPSGSTC